jgi:hypothetical protein
VFFVTEADQQKISDTERLKFIRELLTEKLTDFEKTAIADQ